MTDRLVYDGNRVIVLTLSSPDVEKMTDRLYCTMEKVCLLSPLEQCDIVLALVITAV